ncbi:DUF222 domain-containing protein [Mycolicibacterium doricum]|uniref:DUF222 domain-containing protein n=1 Tax=Mycolicibacterium doricum TaxID=126673 RepID=UPI003B8A622B
MAWKTGSSSNHGKTVAAIAHRLAEFPRCAQALREGRLSLDQVGVIAAGAGAGSDEHYAEFGQARQRQPIAHGDQARTPPHPRTGIGV